MRRSAASCLLAFAMAGTVMDLPNAVAAPVNLRAMMERDVKQIENRLRLEAKKSAKVDRILRKAVNRRMAVLRKHDVTPGVRPPISTLISLKSDMDNIRTENHRELLKILSEPEMQVVEEMAEQMRRKIRSIILGQHR